MVGIDCKGYDSNSLGIGGQKGHIWAFFLFVSR